MKSIVFLVDQLYLKGGIERLVAMKANYWSEKYGYRITIISTEQKNNPKSFALSNNIEFIDLGVNYNREISYFKSENLRKLKTNISALKKELKKINPTHILVASHIPITYVINFIKGNAKTIKEYHYTKYFKHKNNTLKHRFEEKLESLYDFNIVLSDEEKKYHRTKNLITIPNPIEVEIIEKKSVKKYKKMLFLGRIAEVKNITDLIEIWGVFSKKFPEWSLDIYGDYNNEYGKTLIRKIKDLQLSHNIALKGNTNAPLEIMHNYHALLLSSHQECFPMVILEANAQGLPVISYDSPTGPRNMIIQNKNGFLSPQYDIDSYSNILSKFAKDNELSTKMSSSCRDIAIDYHVDKVMAMWKEQIFEK